MGERPPTGEAVLELVVPPELDGRLRAAHQHHPALVLDGVCRPAAAPSPSAPPPAARCWSSRSARRASRPFSSASAPGPEPTAPLGELGPHLDDLVGEIEQAWAATARASSTRERAARCGRSAGADEERYEHLVGRQRPVPGDQLERTAVGRVVEADRLAGHEGDVAQHAPGRFDHAPGRASRSSTTCSTGTTQAVSAWCAVAASSRWRAWPGRAWSQRNRPSPDCSHDVGEHLGCRRDDTVADVDLTVVGGDDERRAARAAPRGCRRRCGRPSAARRRRSRRGRTRGRPCRCPRSRRRRTARPAGAGGRPR